MVLDAAGANGSDISRLAAAVAGVGTLIQLLANSVRAVRRQGTEAERRLAE